MPIIAALLLILACVNGYTAPKFCVDCQHFIPHKSDNRFGKCGVFSVEKTSFFLVTKQIEFDDVDFRHCSTARNMEHMCGVKAKRYVPIDYESKYSSRVDPYVD
jgi:hypothetical protein